MEERARNMIKSKASWQKDHKNVIPRIEMKPIPHSSLHIVQHMDKDLALLKCLSKKRRLPIPETKNVMIRQGPIPDILSHDFQPKAQLLTDENQRLLPGPSLIKVSEPEEGDEQDEFPIRTIRAKPKPKPATASLPHPNFIMAHRYDSQLSKEIDYLMIQRPLVIYMQQRRNKVEYVPSFGK